MSVPKATFTLKEKSKKEKEKPNYPNDFSFKRPLPSKTMGKEQGPVILEVKTQESCSSHSFLPFDIPKPSSWIVFLPFCIRIYK